MKPREVNFTRCSLSVGWSTVLLPFDQSPFLSALVDDGYVLAGPLDEVLGAVAEASGPLARKGDTGLYMDVRRPFVRVDCDNPARLAPELENIERILSSELGFASAEVARYYELIIAGLARIGRSSLDFMRSLDLSARAVKAVGKALPVGPLHNVAIRLVQDGASPLDVNWFELMLEPSFRGFDWLRFNLIYRAAHRDAVLELSASAEETIGGVISALEAELG